jgi:ABC-type sugar transport system ATPase subunit
MSDTESERPPEARDGEVIIALRDVAKRYGAIQALAGVSLELRAGEVHCVAGENGAGKSTLIKILTGAISRDSGSYEVDGRAVGDLTPSGARDAESASSTRSSACYPTSRWGRTC